MELILPVPTDRTDIDRISNEIKSIIDKKCEIREKTLELIENSI